MTIPLIRRIQGAAISAAPETDPALEEALEAHWSPVRKALYYLVGDWDEAQDLALDAFWRLYTSPPRDLTNLGGWLHRVATNLGRNAVRARRRRQRCEEAAGALKLQRAVLTDPAV